jgi:hypothetical protein
MIRADSASTIEEGGDQYPAVREFDLFENSDRSWFGRLGHTGVPWKKLLYDLLL